MKNIDEFWKEVNGFFGDQMIKENYDKYCENFNFIKCEKVGINGDSSYNDILYLLDHLFLFEGLNGTKYYISNTYNTEKEIVELLIKYNLCGKAMILGTGFWNNKTTAIFFNEEEIKRLEKLISKKGWQAQM